jgi:transposase
MSGQEDPMKNTYYVGLDVHHRTVAYCVKQADGTIFDEGTIKARREELRAWASVLPQPWHGGLEATLFTYWIYDELQPLAGELWIGHPARMRALTAGKKKSDRLDARTLADLLRSNLFPRVYALPRELRELRRRLRYRNLLVAAAVQMKNKISGLLMETGVEFETRKLHGKRYFARLLAQQGAVPEEISELLRFSRLHYESLHRMEQHLVKQLARHPALAERVERLMAIDGVGVILALTWALEVGEVERLGSIRKAVSYCGLTAAQRESAGRSTRQPLSKQRNHYLQTALIEVAKIAPQHNARLAAVHERELQRGHRNRATLAVARKLVAYLMAADRGHEPVPEPESVAVDEAAGGVF